MLPFVRIGPLLLQLPGLALLAGVMAFIGYCPDFGNNVAWNSRMAWQSGGTLPLPNVAWNSGIAWYSASGLPMPNVARNSGVAWTPPASPLRVAWNA